MSMKIFMSRGYSISMMLLLRRTLVLVNGEWSMVNDLLFMFALLPARLSLSKACIALT